MADEARNNRRRRVLRAGSLQVLWALALVYLILLGIAFLFGREVGYAISFGVCLGLAALVTAAFGAVHLLDRASAGIAQRTLERRESREPGTPAGRTANAMKKTISTPEAPQAIGPYSQAVEANGFVFLSGQIPLDPKTGTIVQGDIRDQTKRVMENAKAILAAAGCGLDKVARSTIYLKDMGDFGAVNEVYGSYFPAGPPARATVEVSRLPKDAAVEMDFIAVK
jgi:2-iminobutanoate/2-iminopropanoate deaminase